MSLDGDGDERHWFGGYEDDAGGLGPEDIHHASRVANCTAGPEAEFEVRSEIHDGS